MDEKALSEMIEPLIGCLLNVSQQEYIKQWGESIEKTVEKYKEEINIPEDFDCIFNSSLNNFLDIFLGELLQGLVIPKENKEKVYFVYKQYAFLEKHITWVVVQKEGSICSGDKSGWIIQSYLQSLLTGNSKDIVGLSFWNTKFGTTQLWIDFCEGLYLLHEGRPNIYIEKLNLLLQSKED